MNRNSILAKTLLFFAVYTAVVLVLMYVVGMPTTKRMNFVLLSTGVATILGLVIAGMFPQFAWLCRAAHVCWLLIAAVALVALVVTIVCFIAKWSLPLFSQQWYGIFMALGFVAAFTGKELAGSYWECTSKAKSDSSASGEPAMV